MKWLELFAEFLPLVFKLVPALAPHQQTARDAVVVVGDAAALGAMSSDTIKATTLALVQDGARVASDELVAAGHAPLDHAAVSAAASSAIDTAIAVTHLVHASHGTGDAPASTTS